MGIWSDDGIVWLPKQNFPTRNDAKRFAVNEMGHAWVEVRVRTCWMKPDPESSEGLYARSGQGEAGAFECWEVS